MKDYTWKEQEDIRKCYKCFYWFELLSVMWGLCTAWILSITWLVALNDYKDTLDSARIMSKDYAICSNDFINDLLQTASIDE